MLTNRWMLQLYIYDHCNIKKYLTIC
jgi:hypothetical protein